MKIQKKLTRNFAIGVALPVVAVITCAIGFIVVALQDMASEVDRIETATAERTVDSALQAILNRMREIHGDYAVWDDAARSLYGEIDHDFAESNFLSSTRDAVMFDAAYLLDEREQDVFSYRRGSAALRGARQEFGEPLDVLIQNARRRNQRYDAEVGVMSDQAGDLVVVAVGSVLPTSDDKPRPAGKTRLLVITQPLDRSHIERMARDFHLPGLALLRNPSHPPSLHALPVKDPTGRTVGAFTWPPPGHGQEAFGRVAPTAYVMMILIGVTTIFLLGIGYRGLLDVRRRERLAVHASRHDGLTGLPNRAALATALENGVRASVVAKSSIGIIYLDLDGFKEINDVYGHETGDLLLQRVGNGFSAICGNSGFLARIGGDEFALLLDRDVTLANAEAIGDSLVAFFDEPLIIDGRSVVLGTSVGVAIVEDGSVAAGELLRRADVAMYVAKGLGRNRVALYDPSIDAARIDRNRLADDLRDAIADEALDVVYQPIFDAVTMAPTGVEALLRWLHPTDGLVAPDKFIPIAEESGLIEEIGEWVLRRACRDALDWPSSIRLSVNVSPVQFRNPRFDTMLSGVLQEIGIPAERLEIEMTETHLVADPERAQIIIESVRALGVTISLDDFGTGYSSIGYLRRFSFDKLKLDRSLVHGVATNSATRRLCEATIALGRALDLDVTAEGVENEADAAVLRSAGCRHLQGYAFARPMTTDAVAGFLTIMAARPVELPWVS